MAAAGSGAGPRPRACVVVLGDLGRSPRMQYHSLSLAGSGYDVDFVGYVGKDPHEAVLSNPHIQLHRLHPRFTGASKHRLFLVHAVLQVVFVTLSMLLTLFRLPRPRLVLVQTPPAIPALALIWLLCRVRGARMVIDWHNFAYTLMALGMQNQHHLAVRISYQVEKWFARRADVSFCVTDAMRRWLLREWQVSATVLHDRPPSMFRRLSVDEVHALFSSDRIRYQQSLLLYALPPPVVCVFVDLPA